MRGANGADVIQQSAERSVAVSGCRRSRPGHDLGRSELDPFRVLERSNDRLKVRVDEELHAALTDTTV